MSNRKGILNVIKSNFEVKIKWIETGDGWVGWMAILCLPALAGPPVKYVS